MRPPINRPRSGPGVRGFETEAPAPPSATGAYPGPVWAVPNPVVAAKSDGSEVGGRQPSGAGLGDRRPSSWSRAADAGSPIGSPTTATKETQPRSATGQYPGPVWAAEPPLANASQARRSTRAFNEIPSASGEYPARFKDPGYSDDLGGVVPADNIAEAPTVVLSNEAIYRIVREVAVADSGEAAYAAVSLDDEYVSAGNPAYQRRQFGLGFGLLLSTQESGRLGRVLALTRQRDPAAFAEILGLEAESVLAVTNASTPEERLQPVSGENLWNPAWAERFRRLGAVESCQYAQNEEAIEGLFRPMWKVAEAVGIVGERGLAMLFDRVVTCGLGEGLRWALRVAGPLRTAAQRTFALQTLGFEKLQEFQASVPGLPADGSFGAETYGALVAALRSPGFSSLPLATDYPARMVAAATGVARSRLLRLRDSTVLSDILYRAS